jgi:phosphatidylinositol dimannoside acyltransferase
MQYLAWRVVTALVQRLPLRVSYAIAAAVGTATFYAWPRGRRATVANFSHVLPNASRGRVRRVARRSIVNYCKYLVDFVRFPGMSQSELIAEAESNGAYEGLAAALEKGDGAVITCMHFGNWDLGAGAAAARGLPITAVVETFADPRLDAMVSGGRDAAGMQILKMERASPSIARALKTGRALALLIDRPMAEGEGVEVTFFGEPVTLPAGPARLALMAGAPVVAVGFARTSPRSPSVKAFATFDFAPEPTGDRETDIRALAQAIMDEQEKIVRRFPEQWYMFREMWRSTGSDP